MDFALSEEQQSLYKTIVEFARDVVEPGAGERDREGRFDRDVWDACGQVGLTGMCIGEEWGGMGAGAVDTGLALEALSYGGLDAGLGLSLGAHLVIGAKPIELHGTDEQKAAYLPKLASGEWIGAWGITEPDHGSDTSGITSRGVPDGDHWILNGTKTFITNGPVCDVFTVIVRTDGAHEEGAGGGGMTAFILPRDTPGLSVGNVLDKSGNRSSPTSEMVMVDVRVPDSARLGPIGTAQWAIGFECFSWERTVMLGSAIGGMQRGLDDSIAYAKERQAFGKPIAHFQTIAHKLADMKINLESARLMLRYGAWKKDQGLDHQMEASMAKAYVGACALANADAAIQIHGGWGYIKDFPVERGWRDAKLSTIGGGTSEIQKVIISRMLLA
ncbi:acyl-CoA dehydrogenase family protein [Euzebya tangerina]|uniref:acyl-CoA dehydrogenase family protein n=1 Tax=Euzebya tangerina TaxID=591198 RepID=UPI000E3100DD|nr:acyl-CoA dehydrogenase family protein [Euzebya tangerina]